jgi:uncharacterized membrane protein
VTVTEHGNARDVAAAHAADVLIAQIPPGPICAARRAACSSRPPDKGDAIEIAIHKGVHIGRHRTLTQDSEFGIAQVVEIAIRALSPAVNDTFTGVASVDWLAEALLTLAERPPLEGNWYDAGGRLRVWMPPVRLERLAKLAFDQIRQASATTPAVLIRQLEAIRRLAPRLPSACRQTLSEEADAILETGSGLVAIDRRDLKAAHRRARTTLDEMFHSGELSVDAPA